jgi:hypothetical protein
MNSSRWYLSRRATKISAEFGCRTDTLRERLVSALQRRYRKQVASARLIKAVYGARYKARQPFVTSLSSLYATEL